MKIAIATDGSFVAEHFGRCPEYTLVTTNGADIVSQAIIPNPGHKPGFLPRYLANLDVTCIIAGGMGPSAQGLFADNGIETLTGISGPVTSVIDSYLKGELTSTDNLCNHEEGEHDQCQHG